MHTRRGTHRPSRSALSVLALALLLLLTLGACGQEPTPSPTATATPVLTATPEPTSTPEPTPTPTAAPRPPTPTPVSGPTTPVTYEVEVLVLEDTTYELRMLDAAWGYPQGARPRSADGLLLTFNVGDSLVIPRVRSSNSRSSGINSIVNEALGLNISLSPGEDSEDLPADHPLNNIVLAFDRAGTFILDDLDARGSKGIFAIVVIAVPVVTSEPVTYEPVTYEVEVLVLEDTTYQLRMLGAAWGYPEGARPVSADGLTLTFNVGDSLVIPRVRSSNSRSSGINSIVNEALGLNISLSPGEDSEDLPPDHPLNNIVLRFDQPGTFVLDDPAAPGSKGTFEIVVMGAAPSGVTYEVEVLVLEDTTYQLRMLGAAWGYPEGARPVSADGLTLTFNVGDSLVIPRVRSSNSRSSGINSIVNEALGLNISLSPGEDSEDLPPDHPLNNIVLRFDQPGTFVLDDPAAPGSKGTFEIVVE